MSDPKTLFAQFMLSKVANNVFDKVEKNLDSKINKRKKSQNYDGS